MENIEKLLKELQEMGIKNLEVLNAMKSISVDDFSPSTLIKALKNYVSPFSINNNEIEYTLSHPYLVALTTELLKVHKGNKILEVGTGLGYQAAILSYLGCEVYSIERIYYLYLEAKKRLEKYNLPVQLFYKDGSKGLHDYAPFDKIVYTVAMPYYPQKLEKQINQENGIIIIPIGNEYEPQRLYRILFNNGVKTVEKGIYTNFSSIQEGTTVKGPGGFVFTPEEQNSDMFYI